MKHCIYTLLLCLLAPIGIAQTNATQYSASDSGAVFGLDSSNNIISWSTDHWSATTYGTAYQVAVGKNSLLWKLDQSSSGCTYTGENNKQVYYQSGTTWVRAGATTDCLFILSVGADNTAVGGRGENGTNPDGPWYYTSSTNSWATCCGVNEIMWPSIGDANNLWGGSHNTDFELLWLNGITSFFSGPFATANCPESETQGAFFVNASKGTKGDAFYRDCTTPNPIWYKFNYTTSAFTSVSDYTGSSSYLVQDATTDWSCSTGTCASQVLNPYYLAKLSNCASGVVCGGQSTTYMHCATGYNWCNTNWYNLEGFGASISNSFTLAAGTYDIEFELYNPDTTGALASNVNLVLDAGTSNAAFISWSKWQTGSINTYNDTTLPYDGAQWMEGEFTVTAGTHTLSLGNIESGGSDEPNVYAHQIILSPASPSKYQVTCAVQEHPGYVSVPITGSNIYSAMSSCGTLGSGKAHRISFVGDPYMHGTGSGAILFID
jgi:hypothetical protein